MIIKYKITENSTKTLEKFSWVKENYKLGSLGTYDDREITRLLENYHYTNITRPLNQINKYGVFGGEIIETILTCNDSLNFRRALAELSLFIHLYDRLSTKVKPINRLQNKKTPDIYIQIDDFNILLEIYTPMDYYGFQVFSDFLISTIKNLQIQLGFDITINSKATNFIYACDFPDFRKVYSWIDTFSESLKGWLKTAKTGDIYEIQSPSSALYLYFYLNKIYNDSNNRSISWGEATRSTDTRLYFEIDKPLEFSKTNFGYKIYDKIKKQQAGESLKNYIRILAINFVHTDTPDLTFLNIKKYQNRFIKNIKYLAKDIKPYPPFDIVIPCELSFECGFGKAANLSNYEDSLLEKILSKLDFTIPIKEIPKASKEEVDELINSLKYYSKKN